MSITLQASRFANARYRVSRGALILAVIAWLLFVVVGLCALWNYGAKPGTVGEIPPTWPPQSGIQRDGHSTLLLFAHPHCPCTRASFSELARLLAACRYRVDTHVLFVAPRGTDESWLNSHLYTQACRLNGVTVHVDTDRRETRLFAAGTSGECYLYDRQGRLAFHGGITPSRGHEGDNYGRHAIETLLMSKKPAITSAAVFGCPLFESESNRTEERCSL